MFLNVLLLFGDDFDDLCEVLSFGTNFSDGDDDARVQSAAG
jgi:hypothetical protein